MPTPKWPGDHKEKHAAAARLGWARKRGTKSNVALAGKRFGAGSHTRAADTRHFGGHGGHTQKIPEVVKRSPLARYWANASAEEREELYERAKKVEKEAAEKEEEEREQAKAKREAAEGRKLQKLATKHAPELVARQQARAAVQKKYSAYEENKAKRETEQSFYRRRDYRQDKYARIGAKLTEEFNRYQSGINRKEALERKREHWDNEEAREWRYYKDAVYSDAFKAKEQQKAGLRVIADNLEQLREEIAELKQAKNKSTHAGQRGALEQKIITLKSEQATWEVLQGKVKDLDLDQHR